MAQPPKILLTNADHHEINRQVNIAFEQQQQVLDRSAAGNGGVSTVDFAALQAEVTSLKALSGSDVNNGGTGNPAPTPSSTTVTTDGSTITGDGGGDPISLVTPVTIPDGGTGTATPALVAGTGIGISGSWPNNTIALQVPVTIPDGGTGLVQAAVQQITTLGTLIAAGTAQAQPALTLAGVTTTSAAMWSLPNAPDATWQTGIFMILVCTANTVTPWLVNPTAAGITPIAQLVNIKAIL